MSDDGNEDHWLYGNSINPEPPEPAVEDELMQRNPDAPEKLPEPDEPMEVLDEPPPPVSGLDITTLAPPIISSELLLRGDNAVAEVEPDEKVDEVATEATETGDDTETETPVNGAAGDNDDDDEDDSDEDNVQVVIGDIKATPNYSSLNIKRGGLLTSTGPGDKLKQPGKFSIEEFETVGTINGHEAIDFNLDSLEEKPWRKPGADITDYFNYGFNEETWRAYCERQKRIRIHESGVGLNQLGANNASSSRSGLVNVNIANDNSKYTSWEGANFLGQKKAGPPPCRRYAGSIDVIGGGGLVASRRGMEKGTPPKENVIQVMTADRRDYSRKPGFPDMSMPPPPSGVPPPFDVPPPSNTIPRIGPPSIPSPFVPRLDPYGHPMMGGDFYHGPPEPEPYYHSYEPTQDCQWNDPAKQSWQPTSLATLPIGGVKVLTPAPQMVPQPPVIHPPSRRETTPTTSEPPQDEPISSRDKEDSRDSGPITALGVVIKEEPRDSEERAKERSKEKHKERSHRHRSRSRSTERRSRRHKSRSRSPGHRSHRKKKSRRSDRESKEDSE